MSMREQSQTVRIDLTVGQSEKLRRLTGRAVEALELRVEELEERIVPRLAANHNETLLSSIDRRLRVAHRPACNLAL